MMRTVVVAVVVAVSAIGPASATPDRACRVDDGPRPIVTCIPAVSPDGAPLSVHGVEEDGSARYVDGWTIDPDAGFERG